MSKFEVVEADIDENTITLDAGDYFKKGGSIELGEEFILQRAKQHKLSIPKKVADCLDEAFEEYKNDGYPAFTILSSYIIKNITKDENIEKWFDSFCVKKLDLATAYLAGKALGIELVEISDE